MLQTCSYPSAIITILQIVCVCITHLKERLETAVSVESRVIFSSSSPENVADQDLSSLHRVLALYIPSLIRLIFGINTYIVLLELLLQFLVTKAGTEGDPSSNLHITSTF